MSFRPRVPSPEKLPGNIVIEAFSVQDPSVSDTQKIGIAKYFFEIFDKTKAYVNGQGLVLSKNAFLSSNTLSEPLDVIVTDVAFLNNISISDLTSIIKYNPTSGNFYTCKALLQTTAMDASRQYKINTSSPNKLMLTDLSANTELPDGDLSPILPLSTSRLIVRYRIATIDINWN